MKSVLIIGANGFLGIELVRIFSQDFKVIGSDIRFDNIPPEFQGPKIDITNENDVKQKISEINPDIVVLTAAMTDVDGCERDKSLAYQLNALGPKYVSESARVCGAKMVHLSTDFIFDGEKGNYTEEDAPNPISYYGESKLEGEIFIRKSGADFLICRTSVLYGVLNGNVHDNFFTWAYKKLEQGIELSVLTTQINNPTYVKDLAKAIHALILNDCSGIYNTTGPDSVSRYDFVYQIRDKFFPSIKVHPIREFKQLATRPPNASFSIQKLENSIGNIMRPISVTFDEIQETRRID